MKSVAPVVGLASHLGRGVQRIVTDAAIGRVRSLPRTIDDLDAAYLSKLMGRTVTSMSVIGGDAGTSSRARLALTGEDVPDSVFVKMAAETAATRLMGEVGRLAETETRFYKELSPELSGLPKSYGSAFDSMTGRYVLVLEDLPADECEFPDTLHPLDKDRANLIVELLAAAARDILGPNPRLGVLGVGRQLVGDGGAAAQAVCTPDRRAHRHPRGNGPLHRRELPHRGAR